MSCSEDAELRRGHQPLGGTEASFGGFDRFLDLVGGDGVVVAWIGILGLVTASAESVDGLESADAGKLRVDASMITMWPPAEVGRRPWWARSAVAVLRAAS